jgi:hypothetical protein
MKGRRLDSLQDFYRGQPGDYCKVTSDEPGAAPGHTVWYVRDPAGRVGALRDHAVTEHEDGTISVSPSILDPSPGGWHGWLERGLWRAV